MNKLHCLPLGCTMRNRFAKQAQELNKSKNNAALLVPSAFLLKKVLEDGYHLRMFTFDGLAKDIIKCGNHQQKFINRMTQELLMEELLKELSSEGKIPYFSSISSFPGYVSAMTNLIGEIKRSGTLPDEFSSCCEALDNPVKNGEVDLIYHAYQKKLHKLKLLDLEELYFFAISLMQDDKFQLPYTHLFISDFYIFTPLQLELINLLKRKVQIEVAICYEENKPDIYQAVEYTYAKLMGFNFQKNVVSDNLTKSADLEFLCHNILSDNKQCEVAPDNITLIKTCHKRQEIYAAARYIKKTILEGMAPEKIAIVLRNNEGYESLAKVFFEYGIPINLPDEAAVAGEPLARLINNCLLAQTGMVCRELIMNIFKSPLLQTAFHIDSDYLELVTNNYLIDSWKAFNDTINELVLSDEKVSLMNDMLQAVVCIINKIPRCGTSLEFYDSIMNLINSLNIEKNSGEMYKRGQMDLMLLKRTVNSVQVLKRVFEEIINGLKLLGLADRRISALEFSKYLTQVLADKNLVLSPAKGGVKIINPASVHGVSFPVVYIMGLTEGEFPKIKRENWLYNDSERAELFMMGMDVATTGLLLKQENLYFAAAVSMTEEKLILSYFEDDKFLESSYLANIKTLFSQKIKCISYDISQVFSDRYEDVFSEQELVQKTIFDAYHRADDLSDTHYALIKQVFEKLSYPLKRALAGEGSQNVNEKVRSYYYNMLGDNTSYSVSALEEYAFCPFAFFVNRILKINNWEVAQEDADASVIGSIYHEVLAEFINRFAGMNLSKIEKDVLYDAIKDIFESITNNYILIGKLIDSKVWVYEKERMLKFLFKWLEFEISEQSKYSLKEGPKFTEWSFGRGNVLAVNLDTKYGVMHLTGVIDRIDKIGDKYVVYDYKTKSPQTFKRIKTGLALQIPIYLKAVKQQLGSEVIGGGYYIIQEPQKAQGMWKKSLLDEKVIKVQGNDCKLEDLEWDELTNAVENFSRQYVEGIYALEFPVMPAEKCPEYCPGRLICRYSSTQMPKEAEE